MLLTLHLLATAAMAGLIWFVQLVHYPLLHLVGPEGFVEYEAAHRRRTALVVGPLMAVEGVTALGVVAVLRNEVGLVLPSVGLVLLAVIHLSTVVVQVPAHTALSAGYDRFVVRRLVSTNWIRTGGWSLRTIVAALMLISAAS